MTLQPEPEHEKLVQVSSLDRERESVGIQDHAVAEIQDHAMAEAPTRVAHALLYIVRASPSFLFHLLYKSFYHIFHQVMSLDCRAYSLKKHSTILYTPTIVYLMPSQVYRPQKSE